ncbi:SAM-dependent methyltransferase [Actinomadura sp. DC4]|uniref:SAM-dependent methyltransferase n=1 Tax=Actinomadura sp. DC4 TaxID=3055069 RepID=UPI0025B099ED|nr:SAM-dependent methyltransferase [Actinomadura sp. DC4]MDN3354373.1 SAM-dependent methyltransferase [Actinomadura sp. DC4]
MRNQPKRSAGDIEPDTDVPSVARIYDAYLDGKDHFPVDDEAVARVVAKTPWAKPVARFNRAFMVRAVETAARAGIRQIVDVGCGMPNEPSAFSAARSVDPGIHVIGVDNDPMVLALGRSMAHAGDGIHLVPGDVRDPEAILATLEPFVDWSQPVALVLTAVLQFVPDEKDPLAILRVLRKPMAPGSWLLLSHSSTDGTAPEVVAGVEGAYEGVTAQIKYRSDERILAFFEGMTLLEPGLVAVQDWRPGRDAVDTSDIPGPVVRLAGAVGVLPE